MQRREQEELDLGLPEETGDPDGRGQGPSAGDGGKSGGAGLVFVPGKEAPLSPAQEEFNSLLARLEKARARRESRRRALDNLLARVNAEVVPLVADCNRLLRDTVFAAAAAMKKYRFSRRRRDAIECVLGDLVDALLADPVGLDDAEIARLAELGEELDPWAVAGDGGLDEGEVDAAMIEEFEMLRAVLEDQARRYGIDFSLEGIDPTGDPDELQRMVNERLERANASIAERDGQGGMRKKRRRRPSKAQVERQRRREAMEEAKRRDVKTLYKQLAKVLHPDIEPDPELKSRREQWMQRLNAAFERRDLREMLGIEMEWLGTESSHLAQAGEEKLRIYSLVLKEQISDINRETRELAYLPEFHALGRFSDPNALRKREVPSIASHLREKAAHTRSILDAFLRGGASARRMLNAWATEHLESMEEGRGFYF